MTCTTVHPAPFISGCKPIGSHVHQRWTVTAHHTYAQSTERATSQPTKLKKVFAGVHDVISTNRIIPPTARHDAATSANLLRSAGHCKSQRAITSSHATPAASTYFLVGGMLLDTASRVALPAAMPPLIPISDCAPRLWSLL